MAASAVARLIAVVVLPTPPFWLAMVMIRFFESCIEIRALALFRLERLLISRIDRSILRQTSDVLPDQGPNGHALIATSSGIIQAFMEPALGRRQTMVRKQHLTQQAGSDASAVRMTASIFQFFRRQQHAPQSASDERWPTPVSGSLGAQESSLFVIALNQMNPSRLHLCQTDGRHQTRETRPTAHVEPVFGSALQEPHNCRLSAT